LRAKNLKRDFHLPLQLRPSNDSEKKTGRKHRSLLKKQPSFEEVIPALPVWMTMDDTSHPQVTSHA
jgi:hypothetical protein